MPPDTSTGSGPNRRVGEHLGEAGGLYDQVRGRRRKGTSSFWGLGMVISLAVHVLLLALLGFLQFGTPRVKRPTIRIDTDIVEEFQPEPVTVRSVIKMDKSASVSNQGAQLAKKLKTLGKPVPVMSVDRVDLDAIKFDLKGRKQQPATTTWGGGTDLTGKIRRGGDQDYKSAMDAIARPIVKQLSKGGVLVVVLFDGSRSLVKERAILSAQLELTFQELKFAIVERQEKRLRWAVVSYSESAKTILKPTKDIRKVQKALARMPIEDSGKEMVLTGVHYCLKTLSRRNQRMIILLLTDEQGDDVGVNGKTFREKHALERAVKACKAARASVFVLGCESYMQYESITRSYVDPKDGLSKRGSQVLGLSCCHRELPVPTSHTRVGDKTIASGFGCYALSMLAHKTNGTFFIVTGEASPYNMRDLKAYAPELCYPHEYDARVKASRLRRTVMDISRNFHPPLSWRQFYKEHEWSRQKAEWFKHDGKLREKIKWCDRSIDRLVKLKASADRERHARKRWEANYDLTLAQVYKHKFMLMWHRTAVAKLMRKRPPKPAGKKPEGMVIQYSLWPVGRYQKPEKLVTTSAEKNALTKTRRALELVIRKHAGTPWAAVAREELATICPIAARSAYVPPEWPVRPPTIGM